MYFMLAFLKNITIFAFFHVLGIRRCVMHFGHSLAICFILGSSPAFRVSMVMLLSHFSFSSAQHPLPITLLVELLRGMFVLLQLGRCHILVSIGA